MTTSSLTTSGRRVLLALATAGLAAPALAQTTPASPRYDWQWATQLGPRQTPGLGAGETTLGGLAADATGRVVVGGSYQPALSFANSPTVLRTSFPITSTATSGYVVQYAPTGTLAWTVDLAGGLDAKVADVATDAAGNTYAVGFYVQRVAFNGLLPLQGGTSFLVKISPAGVPLWAVNVMNSPILAANGGWQLATDLAGNCVVRGGFVGSVTLGTRTYTGPGALAHPFVARYSAAGALLSSWAGVQTGTPTYGPSTFHGLVLGPAGEVYMSGIAAPGITLQFGNLPPVVGTGNSDTGFLLRITPAGTADWAFNSPGVALADLVISRTSGYLYLEGGTLSGFTLGGLTYPYPTGSGLGLFIAQVRPNGTVRKFLGGGRDRGGNLAIGPRDELSLGFLLNGRWDNAQIDPPATPNDQNIGVIQIDSAGHSLRSWQASGPSVVRAVKIAVDGTGQATFAAWALGAPVSFAFGSSAVGVPTAFSVLVGRTSLRPLAARAAQEIVGFDVFPNPTQGEVHVAAQGVAPIALEVRDALGRTVGKTTLANGARTFALPGLAAGIYLVRAQQGAAVSYRRLSIAP